MKKLRIGIITSVFPPETYTACSMMRDMARELGRKHEVTVVTGFPNRPEGVLYPGYTKRPVEITAADGYRLVRVWTWFIGKQRRFFDRLLEQVSFAASVICQLRKEEKYDLVILLPWVGVCAYLLALMLRFQSTPYFYYIMDFLPEQAENVGLIKRGGIIARLYLWFDRQVCRASAGVLALSEGFKQHCINTRGVPEDKILIAPIYVNTKAVYPLAGDRRWRQKNGIEERRFVVMFTGTMGYVSGLGILREVVAHIPLASDVLFVCIGEGPLKPELEKLAQERDDVRCLPFQSDEDYVRALGAADLALLTMDPNCGQGSVPSKMYSYMAAAKAVLCNAPPEAENTLLVNAVKCGFVVPPNDPKALAEAILALKDKPRSLKEAGEAGYRYILENCTVESAAANLERFWERRLDQNSY